MPTLLKLNRYPFVVLKAHSQAKLTGAIVVAFGLFLSLAWPSTAISNQIRKIDFGKELQIVYPALFKLPKSGCAKIKFKYDASLSVVEDGRFVIDIFSDDLDLVGSTTWYGELTPAIKRMGRTKGSTTVEVCRKPWYDENQDLEFVGAFRGDFEVRITLENISSDYRTSKIRLS